MKNFFKEINDKRNSNKLKKTYLIIKNNIKYLYFKKYIFYLNFTNFIFFYKEIYFNILNILPIWLLMYRSFNNLLLFKKCIFNYYWLKFYFLIDYFKLNKIKNFTINNIYFNLLKKNYKGFELTLIKKNYMNTFYIRYYLWNYYIKFLNKNLRYQYKEPRSFNLTLVKLISNSRFINMFKLNIENERSFYKLKLNIKRIKKKRVAYKFFYNSKEESFFLTCLNIVLNETQHVRFRNRIFGSKNLFFNMEFVYTFLYEYFIIKNIIYFNNFYFWRNLQSNFKEDYFINKLNIINKFNVKFFSNDVPYIFFNNLKRQHILSKYFLIKYSGLSWILTNQLNRFVKSIVNAQMLLVIKKNGKLDIDSKVSYWLQKVLIEKRPPFRNNYFINEFIDIFFYAAAYKSSNLIYSWIARNLNIIFFKKQWKLISFLKSSIRFLYPILKSYFGILGLKVKFKGKIGKVGSFRKKRFVIKEGIYSYSNINLRLIESRGQVFTDTGVIGLQIILSY
uniref:Cytochrome c-type biogenesis protein CcmF_ii n=1 Tax=Gruberia lanceolata TaxID=1978530 RepID=A0A6C0UAM1_9CILI|nr:cytochrome c-type biogenesis protein CcmF_ii [Gruberia lanceolata]